MKLILSISGGGIRGLIPAMILSNIEQQVGKPIASCFDLISGTSTGGIIACMLSVPGKNNKPKYSVQQVVEMYKQFGKEVFSRGTLRKMVTLNGLISTKYSCRHLEALLKQYLGEIYLSQTVTNLLIPTYQITGRPYPYFFKTLHAKSSKLRVENPYLWECARATSAANGYFKPYRMDSNHTFLDGGVFANNPAMCAYAQAKNTYGTKEQIVIISVETGENLIGYNYNKIRNWGMIQWALPFFKQTSISSSETIDYMLRTFAVNGDKYLRFQCSLDKKSLKMDDVSSANIIRLENAAKQTIKNDKEKINEIVKILTR